ncbi:MAG: rhodanese-like domain-containing protein [Sulfurovum sp.]|nr:rhodanese-like domain-containing protein [Sulfurovum sp.]MCB4745727.1 rhodanese-like domain-containing protein [Sulfurovum sp.]MCB4748105.1 rhodanese-like domain-containing protein [Sulfurovum sp.]MCB4749777.1 rhodanese-like domain-containing protein [Sulfurovum sp.]MCB4752217.1 rhodanese-like domain-containing protein [Sulfurovum sp.]
MKKHLLLATLLSTILFAEFKTIDTVKLEILQAKGVPVIDIRTPMEWKETGVIKGAHKMMFFGPNGQPDLAEWFFDLGHIVKDKKQPFIIYCAHANRTKALGKGLEDMGFEHVYELKGGIENGWIKAGKPTVK